MADKKIQIYIQLLADQYETTEKIKAMRQAIAQDVANAQRIKYRRQPGL